jgi:two-component system chemotaxis sensor kinase CheA
MEEVEAIVREFLAETHENLAQLEIDLVALEQDPTSPDLISSIFRTIHTVKGTCGFLGFSRLQELAHAGENLLSSWRDGEIETGSESIDLLLRVVDVLRRMLAAIDVSGSDDVEADAVAAVVEDIGTYLSTTRSAGTADTVGGTSVAAAPISAAESVPTTPETQAAPTAVHGEAIGVPRSADETVRVGVDVLDALVRQVGELVLSRNRLGRLAGEDRDPELVAVASTVRGIVNDLQATVMKTRMQPVSNAWQQLPRLVRDLSFSLGKNIELEVSGGETELDRALIEALRDPLTHVVRNAADHGIESPDQRRAAGKPETARLSLRAYRQGGSLVIEVSDDGRGIDLAAIAERAQAMGLLTADECLSMDDSDLIELVFRPGFSTAAAVSHVSGRGVGMDVVKSAVDAVRGSVQLTSRPGAGTTCRLLLPVTLAITSSVTVVVADHRFAIPQSDLTELVRIDGKTAGVEYISGAPVYRLRGQLLPVVVLADELGLSGSSDRGMGTIAVLQVGVRRLGLLVDAVLDTEDILVEPLDSRVGQLNTYVGAAILADGLVSLVLDMHAIALRAAPSATGSHDQEEGATLSGSSAGKVVEIERRQCLVTLVNGGRRIALPMDRVSRLEDFAASAIEHIGARDVVRYRGVVVPLLRLGRYLERRGSDDESAPTPLSRSVPAVVCRRGSRTVALAVDEIIDIVTETDDVELDSADARIRGAFVLQERVTEVLDVDTALLTADPHFFDSPDSLTGDQRVEVA